MSKFFEYKGKPLVRKGNEIYYGSMGDPEVVYMQLRGKKDAHGVEVATKVQMTRMSTDESLPPMERIKKTAEKPSLYEALDLAYDWIGRK